MHARHLLVVALSIFVAACSKEPAAGSAAAGSVTSKDAPAAAPHVHAQREDLGELRVGNHTIRVFQVAKIAPGAEGDFDLDFPAGAALPATVRGWIGAESGQGSMRVRFEPETPTRMHGHPVAPSPIAEESRLWIEIEEAGVVSKAAIAFRL
jgi:hypothetical protein